MRLGGGVSSLSYFPSSGSFAHFAEVVLSAFGLRPLPGPKARATRSLSEEKAIAKVEKGKFSLLLPTGLIFYKIILG
jgi:hypothetical protein